MPYYAQIDPDGICCAVTETAAEIESSNMIPIQGLDTELLGKKWTGEGWEEALTPEEPQEPEEPPEYPDRIAQIQEQNLILMSALADLYEEILALKEGDV